MAQIPSIGRIVHYRLTKEQAEHVNRRRADYASFQSSEGWAKGAQAHVGNPVSEGNAVAALVVAVWPAEYGPNTHGVNLQAFLDGADSLWVTSVKEGDGIGEWSWPAYVPPKVEKADEEVPVANTLPDGSPVKVGVAPGYDGPPTT